MKKNSHKSIVVSRKGETIPRKATGKGSEEIGGRSQELGNRYQAISIYSKAKGKSHYTTSTNSMEKRNIHREKDIVSTTISSFCREMTLYQYKKSISHNAKPLLQMKITAYHAENTLPQMVKTLPQMEKTLPQMEKTLPQVVKTLPQMVKTLP